MSDRLPSEERQQAIRSAALEHVRSVLSGRTHRCGCRRFGVELEFSIVDGAHVPVIGSTRKLCGALAHLPVVPELGSFQIEVNPTSLDWEDGAVTALHAELTIVLAAMRRACGAFGSYPLPIGLTPRLPLEMTGAEGFFACGARFRESVAYSRRHGQRAYMRSVCGKRRLLDHGSAVALINELHVHLQAMDEGDAVRLFEAAQDLTAPVAAIAANSGWFEGHALEDLEHQIALFADSEAAPIHPEGLNRVGLFPHRLRGLAGYMETLTRFPVWRDVDPSDTWAAFGAVESCYYGWVRLRCGEQPEPHLRVELRVPSTQPTLKENAALAEWMVRAMLVHDSGALSHRDREANLREAARRGLSAEILWDLGGGPSYHPVTRIIERLMTVTGDGEFIPVLHSRLRAGLTPTERLAARSADLGIAGALDEYADHAAHDEPYV